MHLPSFPMAAWLLLVLISLLFWPDPSPLPRLVLAYLLLLPWYWRSVAVLSLWYWLAVARVRLRLCLRVASLRLACFLHILWLEVSLPWQYLFSPASYHRRMERLKQRYGIHEEEEHA